MTNLEANGIHYEANLGKRKTRREVNLKYGSHLLFKPKLTQLVVLGIFIKKTVLGLPLVILHRQLVRTALRVLHDSSIVFKFVAWHDMEYVLSLPRN